MRPLALIRDSVERGVQLELDYRDSRGDQERRRVDPLRVESIDADWYLRGWCHLREAVRTFRLDRISNAVITDEPIEHQRRRGAPARRAVRGARPTTSRSRSRSTRSAMPLLADYIPDGALHDRGAATASARPLRVSHYHGLKRLVASMPGVVDGASRPTEARRAVAEWAAAGASTLRVDLRDDVFTRPRGRNHMLQGFTGWHALILLAIVLLLFGATKLPALAKSVGQSMKVFRSEMKTDDSKDSTTRTARRAQRVRQGQRSVRQVLSAMAAREPRSRNPERRMSLGQHLVELRKRLFRAALAIVVGHDRRLVPLRPRRLEPAHRADHAASPSAAATTRARSRSTSAPSPAASSSACRSPSPSAS